MSSSVHVEAAPDMRGMRLNFLLAEHRLGHYAEFQAFFIRVFDLDRVGLSAPLYLRAPSGSIYALIFLGRSGEPFPSGLEIHAVVPALEPLNEATADRDQWAIMAWIIEGVGGEWTLDALHATGVLFRIPGSSI